jgi:hypothetical protein
MKKPKKITVKFFLNKNLQEIIIDGEICYPLYAQITYDRKNTQIKCTYGAYYKSLEMAKKENIHLFVFEEHLFKRVVNHEISRFGDEFRLKGLGKKYDDYSLSIHYLFNNYLKMRLKEAIQKDAKPNKYLEVLNLERSNLDFFTLFEASQRLFDNLSSIIRPDFQEEINLYRLYYEWHEPSLHNNRYEFPVVMDWLDGSHIKTLAQKLDKIFEGDKSKVEKNLQIIQKIITSKLELG